MIQNYDDLYTMVISVIDDYMKQEDVAEIVFTKNENGTCEIKNKQNSRKFVLMFARFSDEYKVGFAFYVPDQYGGFSDPEWIDDSLTENFDKTFINTLITEHLLPTDNSRYW